METKYISVEISKFLKGPSFHCQKFEDQKYLWPSRTSLEPSKSIINKKGWFFHKIFDNSHLKFEKWKRKKFKNSIFDSPLIVNQTFPQTEFIIGKSYLAHINPLNAKVSFLTKKVNFEIF